MNANSVIKTILALHSHYSLQVLENLDDKEIVLELRHKAMAMDDLLGAIADDLPEKKEAHFREAIKKHFESFGKGLFYNRNIDLTE